MADLDRRSSLSNTARTHHRDDPVTLQQVDQRVEVGIPPEERRFRIREVARQARESLSLAEEEVRRRDRQSIG